LASIDRTAYPRFKRVVSGRELTEAFTPSDAELVWVHSRTSVDQHVLALAVWLKSYQRLGYFPKLTDVPEVVVTHIRAAVGLGADVELAVHDSPRTAKWHRQQVREYLGVVYEPARVRSVAEAAIRAAAQTKDNPADLINVALEELVRQSCELPGYSTLDALTATIRTEINAGFYTTVVARIGVADRARLGRLLVVDPVTRRSEFDRLKAPAKAPSLAKFRQRLEHLAALDALGATEVWLTDIPSGKVGHLAGEARVTDVADFRKYSEDKRLTLLVSLIHTLRTAARDEVCDMFCKRIAAIHKNGRTLLDDLRNQHREESERLLGVLGDVLGAAREAVGPADPETGNIVGAKPAEDDPDAVFGRAGQLMLKVLDAGGGIEQLAAAHEAVAAHHGNNYLPVLERFYRSHRKALFTLVDSIQLEAVTAERSALDAVEFVRAIRDRRSDWIGETTIVERDGRKRAISVDVDAFAGEGWRKILRDKRKPGMLARRHLEVCVFSHLAAELRSGDIAVVGSDSYANLHTQLMSWEECAPLAEQFCAQAGIPADASELVAHYKRRLIGTAARVDAGYPSNTDLVLDGDRPLLKRRKGADRRPEALILEAAIHERIPQRSLLDVITRVAYLTGWWRHLGPASGSDPKINDAMGRYVVTAFTYGGNLAATEMARHMKHVSAHEIYAAGNKHADAGKIHKASAAVINAFAKLDVAGVWGDGQVVAADGSQIDTWENNLLAESHIRYGGFGGLAMRHISNTYIALFTHFIPCGVWEAVYILEGLLANTSEMQPDVIHADTQGQSLPVFGLATLLGFELLPRIRHWHDLIFYRPDPGVRYQHIDSLFGDHAIDWDLIERHWQDLLRTGISIREGRLSSVTLLRRLGNHSRKNRLYKAFRELGRVVRTITLLRFLSEPELREQITAITNRAESFHGFAEWLMFGGRLIGHNDPDHQDRVVKFNELVANCAIYSTALDITDAANALAADGHPVDPDDLATITPYITRTIRRFGDWVLNLTPPEAVPATRPDLEPRALFATGPP
jgi:TnpA family transposase